MRKLELLPTWECEAGYGPGFIRTVTAQYNASGLREMAAHPQLHSIVHILSNMHKTLLYC